MNSKTIKNEKQLTIETELAISLGELAIYVIRKDETESQIVELLNSNPKRVNFQIKKTLKEILREKKTGLEIKTLRFDYYDSKNISHGVAYFKVKIIGTKRELKKVAGENKILLYNWSKNKE